MAAAIALIALIIYNCVIFFTFGVKNHTAVFWFSWAITIIGALTFVVTILLLGPMRAFLRDWLFGFPLVRYGAIYCVIQYTASFTFMQLEPSVSPKIVYPVQIVLLGLYLILAITCFLTKDNIKETESEIIERTSFIKSLRAELAALFPYVKSDALRANIQTLTEEARYSDPVSTDALAEIEAELDTQVKECRDAIKSGDEDLAVKLCATALLTLKERNELCKNLKRSK